MSETEAAGGFDRDAVEKELERRWGKLVALWRLIYSIPIIVVAAAVALQRAGIEPLFVQGPDEPPVALGLSVVELLALCLGGASLVHMVLALAFRDVGLGFLFVRKTVWKTFGLSARLTWEKASAAETRDPSFLAGAVVRGYLAWAACATPPAVYGLVMSVLTGRAWYSVAFGAVTVVLLVHSSPSKRLALDVLERKLRRRRPRR